MEKGNGAMGSASGRRWGVGFTNNSTSRDIPALLSNRTIRHSVARRRMLNPTENPGSFVNNVWYIKILSPEDIQKMGEQAEETLGPSSGQRMSSTGAESHDMVSGLGSLEY